MPHVIRDGKRLADSSFIFPNLMMLTDFGKGSNGKWYRRQDHKTVVEVPLHELPPEIQLIDLVLK